MHYKDETIDPIVGTIRWHGIGVGKLAEIWGCSRNTAASKMLDPSKITVAELRALGRSRLVPMEKLRQAI